MSADYRREASAAPRSDRPWMWDGKTPYFPDGFHCHHGYPPGEYCPACGEIPDPTAGLVLDEHPMDCQCFACEEDE